MGSHWLHEYVFISCLDEDFLTTHVSWRCTITYMSSPTIFPSNFDLRSISDLLVGTQCTTVGSHLPNDFVSLDCLDENFVFTLNMDEKDIWGWDKDLNLNWHWYLGCIVCFLCTTTKGVLVRQVISLSFDWIQWTRTNEETMNSLLYWKETSELHPHFVVVLWYYSSTMASCNNNYIIFRNVKIFQKIK
jgi:hypothetical protein